MFNKLVNYGKAKLLRSPVLQFQENGDEIICRSFPMSFTFSGNRRTFVEDIVFHLTKDGKVCEVAFGLNKAAVDDIMNRGAWSDEARKVMINFLESYKTAYALKRLDYISSIFSNDALIITGSFVKSTGNKELQNALDTFCIEVSFVRFCIKFVPMLSFPPNTSVLLFVAAAIIQYNGNTEMTEAMINMICVPIFLHFLFIACHLLSSEQRIILQP